METGIALWALLTFVDAVCTYVCFQKGKRALAIAGVAGLFCAPILIWFPLVGAFSPAKPDSSWVRHRSPPPQTPPLTRDRSPSLDLNQRAAIAQFIVDARNRGVIGEETHRELLALLETGLGEPTPAPTLFEAAFYPTEPGPTPPPEPPPVSLPSQPAVAPPLPPPAPSRPSRVSLLWEAVASDVALHGLSYLGVLLTIVGVLGFLLFAFADIPDAAQPFVELGIALIFFAWAWFLRRQEAEHVADGMELVGGIVLPLILFAGFVDNAPFPPDFEDGALILVLVISSLLLSFLYAWYTTRRPESVLRYLVAPLLWLGAMTLGFVFKTDEPLTSDAITRLVSPQPALAAVAIALTLVACRRWHRHRLAEPTVRSALVGVPLSYLLTVSMTVGEGWERTWPMIVLGVATLVSAEVLARWYQKPRLMTVARPLLLAGILGPLAPHLQIGWAGLVIAVAYLLLFEITLRLDRDEGIGMLMAAAGVTFGAVMALDDPWSTLIVYALLTGWAHLRRSAGWEMAGVERAFTAGASLLPVGIGYAIYHLLDPGAAWLVMAIILALGSLAVRLLRSADPFWPRWLAIAALLVGSGAWQNWAISPGTEVWGAPAIGVVAVAFALIPGSGYLRLWAAAGSLSLSLAMALESWGLSVADRSLVWAGLGLGLVLVALALRRRPAGHLAAIGHLIGTGSLLLLPSGMARAAVLGAWAVGWMASVVAAELGGDSFTALVSRVARGTNNQQLSESAAWVAPVMAVGSLPVAVVAGLDLWDAFRPSWIGATVALICVGYAGAARILASRRPLSLMLAIGAEIGSLAAIALAAPDSWPMIIASAAVIGITSLLGARLRSVWFAWAGWLVSVLLVVLLGERGGVPSGSLHIVGLVWGVLLLIGGLVADDIVSGRRRPGELVRSKALQAPTLIGAVVVPVALAPVFYESSWFYGWWSIGIGLVYLVVAFLLRAGSATAPGLSLLAVGLTALSPVSPLDEPWLFIVLAGPLVALSWVSARYQSEEVAGNYWLRWDLAPLVVAHLVGGFALAVAYSNDDLLLTEIAFGLLAVLVGLWRRGRAWVDAGNLLIILASLEAGEGWPALALAATSVRGALQARVARDRNRLLDIAMSVVAAGLTWLAFIDWRALGVETSVDYSGYVFGGTAFAVALIARLRPLGRDTIAAWTGLGVTGILAAAVSVTIGGFSITGFGLTTGFALLALSFELLWQKLDVLLRLLAPAAFALAWVTLIPAAGWDRSVALRVSGVFFGLLMVVVSEVARLTLFDSPDPEAGRLVARLWAVPAVLGVLLAGLAYRGDPGDGYALAAGGALLSLGLARAAAPLGLSWLREASMIAALAAINILADAAAWNEAVFAVALVILAVAATVASLWLWRANQGSPWVRSLVTLSVIANVETGVLAARAWPDRALLVAVLLSVAVQAVAVGTVRSRPAVLAIGPPATVAAFILAVAESVTGSAQWYTIPIGLAFLSEVEILRDVRRRAGGDVKGLDVLVLEWAGIGLLIAPGLVEMFTTELAYGLIPFGLAGAILIWGIVTKVRRRVIAAASIAVVSAVLLIFAAAAGVAPSTAEFWIVAAGIGISVMLVAGLIEAYRSRRGRAMARLSGLMEGWE